MVRKQGHSLSNTFRLKAEAEAWAAEQESRIGRGEKPTTKPITSRETLGDLIDLHLEDLKELGRGIGRSKEHTLFRLKDTIGGTRLSNIDREFLVNFAKRRAKQGARHAIRRDCPSNQNANSTGIQYVLIEELPPSAEHVLAKQLFRFSASTFRTTKRSSAWIITKLL
jgi:hypothetical protein